MRQHAPIRIILADDHHIVRRGLAVLLQQEGPFDVVAEAANGEEALAAAATVDADVIILDLAMPRLNGIETARRLSQQQPQLKILMLSMYADPQFVAQALAANVSGYVLKESVEDELFTALEQILNNRQFVSSAVAGVQPADPAPQITSREREVLQLIAEGHTSNEIGDLLSISPHTASRHRANLMQKLNTHTQAGLVRTAVERGLIIVKRDPLEPKDRQNDV